MEGRLEFPEDLLYTDRDEWIRIEGDEGVIGITDYAQDQLGDIVFIELPAAGRALARGETFGLVESVKAVSDLFMPLGGAIETVNEALNDAPETVNHSPYEDGWMIRVRLADPADREGLLTPEHYRRSRASLGDAAGAPSA